MNIPSHIRNVVIPLGAPLHKDGSSMSSIIKIAVIFAMFGKDFTDPVTILTALGITVVVSVVVVAAASVVAVVSVAPAAP